MTSQEAITKLHVMKNLIEWDMPLDYQEVVDVAVEALEKQIPMKPLNTEMDAFSGRAVTPCGNCGETISPMQEYCHLCGQKILWEK